MDDNKTQERLNQYRIPNASSNLSARIIAAAHQRPNTPLWRIILQEVANMFYLPRPAYAISFCLVLGIILGAQNEVEQLNSMQSYLSFLDINDATTDLSYLNEGGWL